MTMLRFSKKFFFFFCLILKLYFSSFYCQLLKSSFFHLSLINWIFLSSLYWKFLLIYEVIVKSSGFFFTSLSWSLLWRLALPFPFDSSFLLWLLWNCFPLDVFILLHLWLLLSFLHQCFLSFYLSNKSILKVLPCSFTSLFFVISFSLQLPFLFLIDSQSI